MHGPSAFGTACRFLVPGDVHGPNPPAGNAVKSVDDAAAAAMSNTTVSVNNDNVAKGTVGRLCYLHRSFPFALDKIS